MLYVSLALRHLTTPSSSHDECLLWHAGFPAFAEEDRWFDSSAFLGWPLCDVERLTPDLKGFAETTCLCVCEPLAKFGESL